MKISETASSEGANKLQRFRSDWNTRQPDACHVSWTEKKSSYEKNLQVHKILKREKFFSANMLEMVC